MIKNKITIAIEDVENQEKFAHYGANLAKRLDREATLTSVASIPIMAAPTVGTASFGAEFDSYHIEEIKQLLEIKVNELCLKCKQTWKNIDYDIELGFLESSLIENAKEVFPFLFLVEGKNQLTTIGEWFGTYETRLAEQIIVPTLVVPKDYHWKPVHDIVYVMRMDDNKAKNLRVLCDIAKELNANLQVMIVAEEEGPESYQNYNRIVATLETFYDYKYLKFQYAANTQSANQIKRKTENLQVSWLAFEHEESSFVDRIFSDLNSKRLILQSEIPVLVF